MEMGRKRPRLAASEVEVECLSLDSGLSSSLQLLGASGPEVMREDLDKFAPVVLNSLQDLNPRVRWAAADAVRALSASFGPTFQQQYHHTILRSLSTLIDDQNRTVRIYAAVALRFFSKHCTSDMLAPILSRIVIKLLRILENNDEQLKVAALGALAFVAGSSEDRFNIYYDSTMPSLKAILLSETGEAKRFLRFSSLECISYVAIAVGKDEFKNDAGQVMEALKSLQGSLMVTDHAIKAKFLQALVNLCSCLGQDFFIYVRDVMPFLIESANIYESVNKSISVLALKEKDSAYEMISYCACQFKEKFFPWINQVAEILVPLRKFDPYFETRIAAGSAMSEQKVAFDIITKLGEALKVSASHFTEALIRYSDIYLPFLLDVCGDDNPDAREAAARGIGVCVMVDPVRFKTHAREAVERLDSIIRRSATSCSDNAKAHAAAVSTLVKICELHLQSSNASEVVPKLLDYLPLKADKTEAKVVHEQLCSMVERFEAKLVGTDNELKSKISAIFHEVVSERHDLATKDTAKRMVALLIQFSNA